MEISHNGVNKNEDVEDFNKVSKPLFQANPRRVPLFNSIQG